MTNSSLSVVRRAIVLATITGLAASAPAAIAKPGKKAKAAKRTATADLIIRDLEVDYAGETLEIYAELANIGGKKAKRSDVIVALSSDTKLDDDDEVIDETSVKRVGAGKSRPVDTEADLPSEDELPSGDLYLLVCADGNNVVKEKNEANNCVSELISEDSSEESEPAEEEEAAEPAESTDDSGEEAPVVVEDEA